jgi:THO complex subunit 4
MQELFKKTVGPVDSVFIIYNSQANSKGMAVVNFTKAEDAAAARQKYHGKIVDGRESYSCVRLFVTGIDGPTGTPLKIEIIVDSEPAVASGSKQGPPSLVDRLGPPPLTQRVAPPLQPSNGPAQSVSLSLSH